MRTLTHRTLMSLSLITALLCLTGTVSAGDKGKPEKAHKHAQTHKPTTAEHALDILFRDEDRRIVVEYFQQQPMGAKPLPPGIAKNYARGKPLPPGIAKRYLPGELQQRLPARAGYEYAVVGADVVLIEMATQLIVDVMVDVLL